MIHTQPLAPLQDDIAYDYTNDTNIKIIKDFLFKNLQISENRTISYINRAFNPIPTPTYTYSIVYSYNSFITLSLTPVTSLITLLDIILDGTNLTPPT
jgi:hypothetical protein